MNDSGNTAPPFNNGPNYDHQGWTPPTPNKGAPAGTKFFNSIRISGYYRSEERWIGGVSGGLAQKYNLDPLIVRGGFVLLAFLGGVGLIAYAAAWALLPEQRDGRIHAEELIRGNFDGAHIAIAIALFVGLTSSSRFFWGTAWLWAPLKVIFWLALVAAIVYGVFQFRSPSKQSGFTNSAGGAEQPARWTQQPPAPAPSGDSVRSGATFAPDRTGTASPDPTQSPVHPSTGGGSSWYGWTPPKSTAPTVKSPGATQFAILLGILLLASAGLLLAQNTGRLTSAVTVWPLLAGLAVTLGGLAVIINGFRGRSSGSGGFFGILGFLAVLATSALLVTGFITPLNSHLITDSTVTPTSVSEITNGYSFAAGDFTLDLTQLDLTGVTPEDLPLHIPIRGAAGEIDVYIPASLAVTANRTVAVGTVEDGVEQDDGATFVSQGGVGISNSSYSNAAATEAGTADIHLDLTLAFGSVRITERQN